MEVQSDRRDRDGDSFGVEKNAREPVDHALTLSASGNRLDAAARNGPGRAAIFGIEKCPIVPKRSAGSQACATPASQTTESKMSASSPHAGSVPTMSTTSRVALVTGASQGIGRVVATALGAAGFRVAAAARSVDQLHELEAEMGALAVPLDVTDPQAVTDAVARVESELGPIDLLVNNAGISGGSGTSWEIDHDEWWKVIEVNVLGPFLCSRAVMPAMVERGAGRIVNVSSNAAFFEIDEEFAGVISSAYMASKAALIRFTEALAVEARPAGVCAFAISPGTVKTDMTAATFGDQWDDPDLWSPPELAADLIVFIASGALDALSGRYIHAATDDWRVLAERGAEILERDLLALRLRSA